MKPPSCGPVVLPGELDYSPVPGSGWRLVLCSPRGGLPAVAGVTWVRGLGVPWAQLSKEPGWSRGAPFSPPAAAADGMSAPQMNHPALWIQALGWPVPLLATGSLVRRAERP